ncbi:MAG: response regulator transcription factor [Defluviitaleaceae bacterium]|nr:response regulator transcription factor [Defluviitaleaceae bacterium]
MQIDAKKILLAEDDAIIASGLVYAFGQEGYTVTHCGSVREAKKAADCTAFDIAVLDMRLPDGTGFEIFDFLKGSGAAVIFLTAADDEAGTVRAFEGGAEDYVTKPFRLRELLARIKRTSNGKNGRRSMLTFGGVSIDAATGKAYADGNVIELTALEYRLLVTFASNKGQLLSRRQILESLWDSAGNFVEDNTLSVYIKRLREKLGGAASIETVRGLGYRAG